MSDFEKLINASDLIEWIMETYPDWCVGDVRSIVEHVEEMPSAQSNLQPTCNQLATDCISRQAAIDIIEDALKHMGCVDMEDIRFIFGKLPSVQPELTDWQAIEHLHESGWMQNHDKQMYEMGLREQLADDNDSYDALLPSAQPEPDWDYSEETKQITLIVPEDVYNSAETIFLSVGYEGTFGIRGMVYSAQPSSSCVHENDSISRRAAIDAVVGCTNCGTEDELRAYVTKHYLDNGWTGGIVDALDAIEQLPSTQPEIIRCGECKYMMEDGRCYEFADDNIRPSASDFCSYAERQE